MRILSKYSDYYDIGISYGIDKKLVFERYQSEYITDIKVSYRPDTVYLKNSNSSLKLFFNYIVFCEKIYPFIQINEINKKGKTEIILKKEFIYSKEELFSFLKPYKKIENYIFYESNYFKEEIENFFKDKYIKPFLSINTNIPYFILETNQYIGERKTTYLGYKYTANPILKNYKFIKILEPLKAYQKIAMYLGHTKVNENSKSLDIEDKYLIEAKGFNKYSFRKSK